MTLWLDNKWKSLTFLYSGLLLMSFTFHGLESASLNHDVTVKENRREGDIPRSDNIEGQPSDKSLHRTAQILESPLKADIPVYASSVNTRTGKPSTDYDEDNIFKIFQEKNMKHHPVQDITGKSKETKSKISEEEQQQKNDFKRYSVVLLAWLIFPVSKASYFTTLELFDAYSDKIGVPPEVTLLILIILQCVDFVALTRGRWKIMDGGMQNMQQEMLDYFLANLGASDHQKVAVQLLLPTNDWPEYEQKK